MLFIPAGHLHPGQPPCSLASLHQHQAAHTFVAVFCQYCRDTPAREL